MEPSRAKLKLLNSAVLSDIASRAVEKRLKSAEVIHSWRKLLWSHMSSKASRPSNGAGLYMLDKRFNGEVLRRLKKCSSAELSESVVSLHGHNEEAPLKLDPKLFTAILEHSGLAIPSVELESGFGELNELMLSGVESLKLVDKSSWRRPDPGHDQLLRIVTENNSSLRVLSGIPQELFDSLPWGLVLDEFSISNVDPCDVQIPALNTKVFKYEITDDMKIPLAFMRIVKADEIHLKAVGLLPGSPMKPFGAQPPNSRTKKLRVEFADEDISSLDFCRIFHEVAAFFPKLECFELVHEKHFKENDPYVGLGSNYVKFTGAVDELVAGFERAFKEAGTAPYEVNLTTHVWYTYKLEELLPAEADFKCGLLQTDLPPSEEVKPAKQHSYFVKEMSTDGRNLRVDCEIVEETVKDETVSFRGYNYNEDRYEDRYDYEDHDGYSYGYEDPYDYDYDEDYYKGDYNYVYNYDP